MSYILSSDLQDLFYYCPTGKLLNKVSRGKAKEGQRSGIINADGYVHVFLRGKIYKEHILIWALLTGEYSKFQLDHINGDRADNRIENLREVTHKENAQNRKVRKESRSGIRGVTWKSAINKWAVYICFEGKNRYLGYFSDLEEAKAVYVAEAIRLFPNFNPDR